MTRLTYTTNWTADGSISQEIEHGLFGRRDLTPKPPLLRRNRLPDFPSARAAQTEVSNCCVVASKQRVILEKGASGWSDGLGNTL
jgi:hypothetical protein